MLKFTTTRNDFLDSYKVVSSTISSATEGVASNVLFRVKNGMVEMLTFNGTTKSMSPVTTSYIDGSTTFCMEGKRLNLLLNAMGKSDTVEVIFDDTTKVVSIRDSNGTQKFKTFDASMFPIFDSSINMEEMDPSAQVRADALVKAVKVARQFTDAKSIQKKFSVILVSGGSMFSSDGKGIANVEIPGIENLNYHIFSDAGKSLVDFLSKFKDQMVSIYQTSTSVLYVMPDGATFVEELCPHTVSAVDVQDDPIVTYNVDRTSLEEVFQWLRAGADWSGGLVANLTNLNGNIRFSCESNTGDKIVRTVEAEADGDVSADFSFPLNLDSFHRIFDVFENNVQFSVKCRSDSRNLFHYVSASNMDELGNTYKIMISQESRR